MTGSTAQIRRLNDLARLQPDRANASWIMTPGVAQLLAAAPATGAQAPAAFVPERVAALRHALASFSYWDVGDDLYGEHDFGAFDLFDERLVFRIDYYHPDHDSRAPDRADIEQCRRVLVVMCADET